MQTVGSQCMASGDLQCDRELGLGCKLSSGFSLARRSKRISSQFEHIYLKHILKYLVIRLMQFEYKYFILTTVNETQPTEGTGLQATGRIPRSMALPLDILNPLTETLFSHPDPLLLCFLLAEYPVVLSYI